MINPNDPRAKRTLRFLAEYYKNDLGLPWLKQVLDTQKGNQGNLSRFEGLQVFQMPGPFEVTTIGRVAAGALSEPVEDVRTIIFPPGLDYRDVPYFGLVVEGTSMKEDGIWPGDIVFVGGCPEAANGQTVVAKYKGETTLKKWYRKGRKIVLKPANEEMGEIFIEPAAKPITADEDDVKCIGEYLGHLRIKPRRLTAK